MDNKGVERNMNDMREKQNKTERAIITVVETVLQRMMSDLAEVRVSIGLLGNEDYKIRKWRQTTLHEFADLGIEPPKKTNLIFLDISINRLMLKEIDSIVLKLMDAMDEIADEIRLG